MRNYINKYKSIAYMAAGCGVANGNKYKVKQKVAYPVSFCINSCKVLYFISSTPPQQVNPKYGNGLGIKLKHSFCSQSVSSLSRGSPFSPFLLPASVRVQQLTNAAAIQCALPARCNYSRSVDSKAIF